MQQVCARRLRSAGQLQAAQKPTIPWPKGGLSTDATAADYDTNVVYIPLVNSFSNTNCDLSKGARVNCQRVSVDTGYHPWRNQYRWGHSTG
jgi:hypothetical protein